ncbi:ABC transporter substrate-binding protein [Lutispora thermophila]|uniref:Putative ABC transport system substrate-binding protein n=1 Tax=Lutispora thermophila DSM 19022 TaxID=1122184 RepID=A0A1M6HZR7_9FIRM|nr:ABC transporter substrate-binding protein [Lutispora thermophila]SHJ27667.1 putative ABC transport system substrate-binding protein [Lutispora thermophila DSM 19022]
MVVKQKSSVLFVILLFIISLLSGCVNTSAIGNNQERESTIQPSNFIEIGIIQIVEHPALDSARQGFIDALASKGFEDGENIRIDFQNAQGDFPTAQTIAQNFASNKKDMIFAIATPAAQAAFNATKEIPILITAVTDPVDAGLAKSLGKPETNVTGTSDAAPMERQFELLKRLIPDAKNIGIIYNTSERNSEIQVDLAKKLSDKFGFEIITKGVTNTNEVPQVLDSLASKIDVLYVPTDNLVASAIAIISEKCMERKVPVVGSEKGHVEGGAIATEGIDYYKLGFQTGLMAVEVLNGSKTHDMPITTIKDTTLTINAMTAEKLNISIPQDLMERAEVIKGGGAR